LASQRKVFRALVAKSNEFKVPLTGTGDLFHTSRVPDEVLSMIIEEAHKAEYGVGIIAGNHDLPYHSWDNVHRSSFGVLWQLAVNHQSGFFPLWELGAAANWGLPLPTGPHGDVLFLHRLVFKSKADLPPNVEACTAQELLDEFPDFRWICTGDMHRSFHYTSPEDGRHVVNPGCLTRQAADFKDYVPGAWLVDTVEDTVSLVLLPDDEPVIDDAYLKVEAARDERIAAFVEQVKHSGHTTLDFMANVEDALLSSQLSTGAKSEVKQLLEAAQNEV
jgi:hypothetical protein